jgi:hypothetical protein
MGRLGRFRNSLFTVARPIRSIDLLSARFAAEGVAGFPVRPLATRLPMIP